MSDDGNDFDPEAVRLALKALLLTAERRCGDDKAKLADAQDRALLLTIQSCFDRGYAQGFEDGTDFSVVASSGRMPGGESN